jgi:hypothetical protein
MIAAPSFLANKRSCPHRRTFLPLGAIAFLLTVSFANSASEIRATSDAVQIKIISVDPAISRLSTEELIDRLRDESNNEFTILNRDGTTSKSSYAPAFEHAFLPVDTPVQHQRRGPGLFFDRRPTSAVMAEIVSRGISALPALLTHLSDAGSTQITWPAFPERYRRSGNFFMGSMRIGDYYEYRNADKSRQPKGVNTELSGQGRSFSPEEFYTFKVADLCFRAVGQIVNRAMNPETSGPFYVGTHELGVMGNASLLVSPIESPALAAGARMEWSGLTAKDHEQALRDDVANRHGDSFVFMRALGALQRLLYYYPQSGREVAQALLTESLTETDYYNYADLVVALDPFQWDGLDETVFNLYQSVVQDNPTTRSGRLLKFDLTFACAKRLVHRGHDKDFEDFFRGQIDQINPGLGRTEGLEEFLVMLRDSKAESHLGK